MRAVWVGLILMIGCLFLHSGVWAYEASFQYTSPPATVYAVYLQALKEMEETAQVFYTEKKQEKIGLSLLTPDNLFANVILYFNQSSSSVDVKVVISKEDERIVGFVLGSLDKGVKLLSKPQAPLSVLPSTPAPVASAPTPSQPQSLAVTPDIPSTPSVVDLPTPRPMAGVGSVVLVPTLSVVTTGNMKPEKKVTTFADVYGAAYSAYVKKNYKRALQLYKKALTMSPANPDVLVWQLKTMLKYIPQVTDAEQMKSRYKEMLQLFDALPKDMDKNVYQTLKQDVHALKQSRTTTANQH